MKIKKILKKVFSVKQKPIVTLTTIPTRLVSDYGYHMKYCLESLLNQKYDDYEVHLNIPFIYKKTNERYIIPDWLKKMELENNKLKIFRTDDYGSITKIIPTILRIDDPKTLIIVVDDDLVYKDELITEHIKNSNRYPNNPVGYDGMRSRDENGAFSSFYKNTRDYYYSANHRDCRVDIIQHYKSVVYKRKFFGDDFIDFVKEYENWSDDLVISAYFALKKIDRFVTFYEKDKNCEDYEEWGNHVGISFPIVRHTEHRSDEGCNVERAKSNTTNEDKLYKIIDVGYVK